MNELMEQDFTVQVEADSFSKEKRGRWLQGYKSGRSKLRRELKQFIEETATDGMIETSQLLWWIDYS
jgi:hypothetical protein